MPIYVYRCRRGHEFELLQKVTDPSPAACPECGAVINRVFSNFTPHFKGKGFHNTDYRHKSKANADDE